MKVIYKYQLPLTPEPKVEMPIGAEILSCRNQFGNITIWALVDDKAKTEIKEFYLNGSGQKLHDITNHKYIDTVQLENIVYHVWVKEE